MAFTTYRIPSESMEHTLEVGDRIGVEKVSQWWRRPARGDVIVFWPEGADDPWVKRVVAVGGESVGGRGGVVYVDGEALTEPYLEGEVASPADFGPVVVPDGHLFVMGDNRDQSRDSRIIGSIPEEWVVGRAVGVIWPAERIGGL